MDGSGGMDVRNWGILEPAAPTVKNHLGLQLMPSMDESIPLLGGVRNQHQCPVSFAMPSINGGPFHHHRVGGIFEPQIPIEYWMSHTKSLNALSGNHCGVYFQPNFGVPLDTSSTHSMQLPQQTNLSTNEGVIPQIEVGCQDGNDGSVGSGGGGGVQKRGCGNVPKYLPKEKKRKARSLRAQGDASMPPVHRTRAPKRSAEVVINGMNMDISRLPIPVCSCTGTPHQCYRWGSGGWQSACCTTVMSVYPLPMSTKRRGARIAGRKMSIGAFKKVLEKLVSERYDFSDPIDLKNYWAKHGTNKFVTIR